jgi:protein CpxP
MEAMMIKRVLIAAGLAAALATGTTAAAAQAPPEAGAQAGPRGPRGFRGPGGPGDFGLRGIELTDAQRDQVRAIVDRHRDELGQVRDKLREAHRGLAEATRAESIDEATVRARAAAIGNLMADEAILRARIHGEILPILTAEQRQTLQERRTQRRRQ